MGYQCDMALAGGVAIAVPQNTGYLYQEGGMFSSDGHCRSFDAQAAGTVFSNGVGVVVLKRLEDALRDGDQIDAVIRGAAINNDGAGKVSFAAPSVDGQAEVISLAQAYASVHPDSDFLHRGPRYGDTPGRPDRNRGPDPGFSDAD